MPQRQKEKETKDSVELRGQLVSRSYNGLTAGRNARESGPQRPTTARALVLRNGKHGAMGSGEIMSPNSTRISGREKLKILNLRDERVTPLDVRRTGNSIHHYESISFKR